MPKPARTQTRASGPKGTASQRASKTVTKGREQTAQAAQKRTRSKPLPDKRGT